ncbi:hypothetical protein [Marinicella meishanensis]|nr:hypothetical protein [Marinicella sp. NBU2979]
MMVAMIISFGAAPVVYGLYPWYEGNHQRQRKLKRLQRQILQQEQAPPED